MKVKLSKLGDLATITQGLGTRRGDAEDRSGEWILQIVSVGDILDDRLSLERGRTITLERNVKTEKHLLKPYDLLVTARSTTVKAAMVPPAATRTIADSTLLVVRPREAGLGPFLWWFVTSNPGRAGIQARMAGTTNLLALTATNLSEVEVPVPDLQTLDRVADLVDASERAYLAATEAAQLRRTFFREAIVAKIGRLAEREGETDDADS